VVAKTLWQDRSFSWYYSSVASGAGALDPGSALGEGEADVADESDELGSAEGSEKLRCGELVVVLMSVLVWVFVWGMSSLGVAEGEAMEESETNELILGLDEVSRVVMLVSELVMIAVSSVPVLGLGFVFCEESVSWRKVVDWRSGEEGRDDMIELELLRIVFTK
jgi:hypothetical protein